MKKQYVKRACAVLGTLIAICGIWWLLNRTLVMKREDGITSMQDFYVQEPNTVDVLVLGSSHAGTNIDLELWWSDYGYSSYALWGSKQPIWNSYSFLKEALKTQTPKVVVLDLYGLANEEEYADDARQVTNIAGMKLSLNKIEAVKASAPKDRWADLILGLPIYHSRYGELDDNDFRHYPWTPGLINDKGYSTRFGSNWMVDTEFEVSDDLHPLTEKQETYLLKIIDTCKQKDIPLILVVTPTAERSLEQPYYNAIKKIAEETGTAFYNLNTMDEDTGIATDDFSQDNSHLNTQGARKIARYLVENVLSEYALEDHRGSSKYDSWNVFASKMRHTYLSQINYLQEYLIEVREQNLSTVFVLRSPNETAERILIEQGMTAFGNNLWYYDGAEVLNNTKLTEVADMLDENKLDLLTFNFAGEIEDRATMNENTSLEKTSD